MNARSTRTFISGTPLCTGTFIPGAATPQTPDTSSPRNPELLETTTLQTLNVPKELGCEHQRLFLYKRSTKTTTYSIYLETSAMCCIFISPGRKASSMVISVRLLMHVPSATSLGHAGESLAQRCHHMPTATSGTSQPQGLFPRTCTMSQDTGLFHGTKSKVCAEQLSCP